MEISKEGHQITSIDEWFAFAPPKMGLRQWVDGRSAKELAKSFFDRGSPQEPAQLLQLLASSNDLGRVRLTHGWPEHKIPLDSYRGETRNADFAAIGMGTRGVVAITIEAKADESFGETIEKTISGSPSSSNRPKRIAALTEALLVNPQFSVGSLRYQLLHGLAATLIFAQEHKATAAVFVILEFESPCRSRRRVERNTADLVSFLHRLSPSSSALTPGALIGPIIVPGGGRVPSGMPLFIGKAVRAVT